MEVRWRFHNFADRVVVGLLDCELALSGVGDPENSLRCGPRVYHLVARQLFSIITVVTIVSMLQLSVIAELQFLYWQMLLFPLVLVLNFDWNYSIDTNASIRYFCSSGIDIADLISW